VPVDFWDGLPRTILVSAMGNECLPGRSLLEGYWVQIEVADGGKVVATK